MLEIYLETKPILSSHYYYAHILIHSKKPLNAYKPNAIILSQHRGKYTQIAQQYLIDEFVYIERSRFHQRDSPLQIHLISDN